MQQPQRTIEGVTIEGGAPSLRGVAPSLRGVVPSLQGGAPSLRGVALDTNEMPSENCCLTKLRQYSFNPLTRYTHILFDHDGVLVDTEPLYYRATKECLAPLGVELALDHYLALMVDGASPWEMARPLGASDADIEHWRAKRNLLYQELLASEPIEIDGVEEILAKLRERYCIAIVTTAKPEDFALIHRHRNIVRHTDFVLTREAYQRSKPHPDPYLAAMARYGIGPSKALAVEDSQRGLRAAVAAGLDCAVVHHPFTASQDFSLATYRVASLAELASEILGNYPNLSMVE